MKHTRSSVHQFTSLADAAFTAHDYSRLKFGSDVQARRMGYSLADDFFEKHSEVLLASRSVVIPSPYSFVKNAATIMTGHFMNRLNELLVAANGEHLDYDVIKRAIGYISDYGFLSAAKRRALIGADSFYLNREFYAGKNLIFVDDVRITGAHEDRLVEVLAENDITNDAFFIYFAEYSGDNPKIEAELNFAAVKSLADYDRIAREPGHHTIVRPIKYLLGYQNGAELRDFLTLQPRAKLEALYYSALGEGYTRISQYRPNLNILTEVLKAA